MKKIIIHIFVAYIPASILSGCFGFAYAPPGECDTNNISELSKSPYGVELPLFKKDFLSEWGYPDEIIKISKCQEEWIYKKKIWCGFVLAYIIPVPFMLPTCDGLDRITFEGEIVQRVHLTKTDAIGCLLPLGGGGPMYCPPDIENTSNK